MRERSRVVRPAHFDEVRSWIASRGCLVAALLAIAGLCGPNVAAAADAGGDGVHRFNSDRADPAPPTAARRGDLAPRPEVLSGVVVLRGSRPANPPPNPNIGEPSPSEGGEGYGSSVNALPPGVIDFGNVGGFDFSGLNPPVSAVILGQ
jgi:hypothetical protein